LRTNKKKEPSVISTGNHNNLQSGIIDVDYDGGKEIFALHQSKKTLYHHCWEGNHQSKNIVPPLLGRKYSTCSLLQ
jgi:hypothetical protein